MTIQEGLFKLDVIDHHAVLGFSLAAEPKQVRKRYLKVARQLHPDSLREASESQKRLAGELLSKMVNPAYEALSQEKSAKEHSILLKMKQEQLVARPVLLSAKSDAAKKLLGTSNLEQDYAATLNRMAQTQFDDLARVHELIGQISELNAVYLMRKGSIGNKPGQGTESVPTAAEQEVPPPRRPRHEEIIESYVNRAKEFEYKQDYSRAILELREAIDVHPQSAPCHGYLASLYWRSGQATLAKIHAKQALTFDPGNELAKVVQTQLSGEGGTAQKTAKGSKSGANSTGQSQKGGGLFSGLFGGKKR